MSREQSKVIETKVKAALKKGPRSKKEIGKEAEVEDKVLTQILQKLRRRGEIQVRKDDTWALATVQICPNCKGRGWVNK